MILADKIINLRKKNGMSQEELAGMMNVSRQSVSKWESAQVVPDLNKIIMLSQIFSVSTDTLLKDEIELEDSFGAEMEVYGNHSMGANELVLRAVSMEEANEYLSLNENWAGKIALGVAMCILSPIALILLSVVSEMPQTRISENVAAGLGVITLLMMIAGAVAIFVISGVKLGRFEYLEKEAIETAYGVSGMVRDRKDRHSDNYTRELVIGIVLCVLSAVPMMATVMVADTDILAVIGVCFVLVFVAAGVYLICKASTVREGYQKLLEEGEYSRVEKSIAKKSSGVMRIYWSLVTAGYLAYSFITFDWGRSWIVWPVAGVLSAVIKEITKMIRK